MNTGTNHLAWVRSCAIAALSLTLLSPAAESRLPMITLLRDGQPAATIVIAQTVSHIPWFAATELQYHIKTITGATLPVVIMGVIVMMEVRLELEVRSWIECANMSLCHASCESSNRGPLTTS